MTIFLLLFLAIGMGTVGWHLWIAMTTGVVREEIWFGADRREDHYGFVVRVAGLLILLGILIFAATQVPALVRVMGE